MNKLTLIKKIANYSHLPYFILLFFTLPFFTFAQKDCNSNNSGLVPLNDLGTNYYRGFQGGLFSGGVNSPNGTHRNDLLNLTNQIVPLDTNGLQKSNGKIVMIGVGASNPRTEFNAFVSQALNLSTINKSLAFVNTCIGGQGVQKMNDPNDNYWKQAAKTLDSFGFNPLQVQVAWIETENTSASDTIFPNAPQALETELRTLLATLLIKFPNLKICYLSPRAYSGFTIPSQGGVGKGLLYPRDYYNGWAIKWLIEKVVNRQAGYLFEGSSKQIPYCTFGSYHWTDGETIRKDGFGIDCDSDIGSDGLHLSETGEQKIGTHMLDFFKNDDLASRWFLENNSSKGIDLIDPSNSIIVFPNPMIDEVLTIKFPFSPMKELKIGLFDISGQIVYESILMVDTTNLSIQLPELVSGFYTLTISNDNELMVSRKIIR